MLEGWNRERIVRNGLQQVSWNDDSYAFLKSFGGFLQKYYDKIASSLKNLSRSLSGSCRLAQPQQCVRALDSTE